MLSSKILCVQEGQLDKENFGISKLITLLYSDGILAIIATFPTWLSRLKALSASMSCSTCKPQLKRADTVRPCSAGWVRFSLSTKVWEIRGLPIGGLTGRAPLSLEKA
jgi:hypothetical protein